MGRKALSVVSFLMSITATFLTVSDLHRSAALLMALSEVVAQRKPDMVALVGDVLHAF